MEVVTQNKRPRTAPKWTQLYDRRKSLGDSQESAAAKIEVSQSALSAWEAGDYPPRRRYYAKLADYLQMTPAELAMQIQDISSS